MARIEVTAANFPGSALKGSGTDTLVLVGGGIFDFSYVTMSGFSAIVAGSPASYATVKISGEMLAGIVSVSSLYGLTSVYLTGETIDLSGKIFDKINGIFIADDNATVTVSSLPLALRLNAFERQGEKIVLNGPIATPAARDDLHRNGFDAIVEGTNVWTDAAPTLSQLAGGHLYVKESQSVRIDPEGDAFVTDDKGRIAFLDITLSNKGYFFTMNHFKLGTKFRIVDGSFSQNLFYKGSLIGTIQDIGHSGPARISFDETVTPEIVSEFIQNLAYTPGDFVHYRNVILSIAAGDQGGRKSEVAVFDVTAEPRWTPTQPTLNGTSVAENSVAGTVVGTLKATDANGDPITYVLIDDAGGRFAIQNDKLVVSGNVPLDYEQATQHTITVVANDGWRDGLPATFVITILDVREGPNVAPSQPTLSRASIAEDAAASTIVGTLKATDGDGDPVNYVLSDDAGGRFSIKGDKLVVSGKVPLDFETASQHTITVIASDGDKNGLPTTFTITVNDVLERLIGTGGKNKLAGSKGKDLLNGKLGNDTLSGGSDKDIFVFDTKLGKTNIDRITDFARKLDKIHFENAIFKKLGKAGALKKGAFYEGSAAHDQDDRIIYNKKTGALYYDEDGTGAAKAVQFAILSNKPKLAYTDFLVI
ncbi:cadherin domain-containing protein [Microvirga terricola]|uniref:Cadherin domain-containing protein n=1 Tax=Microvirga terricola TaxID=2719797 RepID=A0ABX0V7A9_9HYPH|nr:cadherin domain-containing protein [Microvirga terricola]NIX75729.1 hypothetical protein [Microvirga terricola]